MTRPAIALSMHPGLERYTLRPEHMAALAEVGDVLDPGAVDGLPPERAAEVLAAADVLVGHWGCALVDEAFLARAPRLRMLAYGAGTLRDVATPAAFARLERITSGAAANAVPVAEYTVGAILWSNKAAFVERERLRGAEVPDVRRRHPVGNWAKRIGLVGASHVGRAVIELLRALPLHGRGRATRSSRRRRPPAWAWPRSSSASCWPRATSSACTPPPCPRPSA